MRNTKQLGTVGSLLLGIVFAVAGYFVAFSLGKPILNNAQASTTWPKVTGSIAHSEVTTHRSKGKTHYSSDIEFQYQVAGRDYSCNTVFFGGNMSSTNSSAAYAVTGKYPKGAKVDVYYEPNNPANAVLEPGAHWQSYVIYVLGLVFLVIGVLMSSSALFYVVAAGVIIGGAATGLVTGSSTTTDNHSSHAASKLPLFSNNNPPSPGSGNAQQPSPQDDGFNIY